jgi:hypothetical protein
MAKRRIVDAPFPCGEFDSYDFKIFALRPPPFPEDRCSPSGEWETEQPKTRFRV